MLNKEFLKTLTILYVEDDIEVRNTLSKVFSKAFKKVYYEDNGKDALDKYSNSKNEIDAIICDINMPKMNGIELLEKVRVEDEKLPFLLTTAYSDTKFLLKAINLNASYYAVKPLNISDLILKIQDLCEARTNSLIIYEQKRNLEEFLNIINQVAIISKTDKKGVITYANENFLQVSAYSLDELLGKTHNIVRHPDVPASIYKELWETILSGEIWKGKLKNRAKDGNEYYVNSTILPVYDDYGKEIVEYVGIRFLTTQEETKSREFKKRVISNVKETREYKSTVNQKIANLENQLKKQQNIYFVEEALLNEKKRNSELKSQISFYEEEISDMKERYEDMLFSTNEESAEMKYDLRTIKNENEHLVQKMNKLEYDKNKKVKEIDRLNQELIDQSITIKELKETLANREEQLGLI